MNRLSVGAFLALLLLAASVGSAQVCSGYASLERAPYQISVSGAFASNSKFFGAGFTYGSGGPFGTVGVGTTSYNDFNGSSFDIAAGGGWQVPVDRGRRFQLCPTVGIGYMSGPNNISGSGTDYSETNLQAGVSAGVLISSSGPAVVVPVVSFAIVNATAKLSGGGVSNSKTSTFGEISLGVGLVYFGVATVQPSVRIPIGLSGGVTTYGVGLALNFGKSGKAKGT